MTVEILGPLILSVVVGRRLSSWMWATLSFIGVVVLGAGAWGSPTDWVGFAFAGAAAGSWVAYILAGARAARVLPPMDALSLATCLGAVALVPVAALAGREAFTPIGRLSGWAWPWP